MSRLKFADGKWEEITLTLCNSTPSLVSDGMFKMIKISESNERDNGVLFRFYINSIDPTGLVVDKCLVSVEDIISIDFGELDYGNSDTQTIVLKLKISDCAFILCYP